MGHTFEWQIVDIKQNNGTLHMRSTKMVNTLNLSITDELRCFIDENCGDGTL